MSPPPVPAVLRPCFAPRRKGLELEWIVLLSYTIRFR